MIAHKIELKANNYQITYFKQACGVARLAWNWGLSNWQQQYIEGLNPSGMSLKKEFNSIKKEQFPFVYNVTKYAVQQPFLQLQEAYKRFFKKIGGKPKFKKKGKSKDSFYIGGDQIKVERQKVKIPNLGWVKLREDIRFQGKILNATVSRIADKWFISFAIKPSMSYLPCKNQASVGIDLGIKKLAVLSDGSYIESPRPLKKLLRKLKRLSRQLSRKKHSRKKGELFINDRWFASSKTCCNCGNQKKDLTLSDRTYYCDECNLKIDRDLNASINLHNQLGGVHPEVTLVEITAMNLEAGLLNLTSIFEAGNKHQAISVA